MSRYRYSEWDGSQEAWTPALEEVLDSLTDSLLQGGDLEKALRALLQRGMQDRQGREMPGWQDILQALRAMKAEQLERYDANSALDKLRQTLHDIVAREQQTLTAQLEATRQRLADVPPATDPETAQQHANEARAVQEMEDIVAERQAQLEALPPEVGETVRRLQQYDFVDQQARAAFEALLHSLQQQTLDSLFQGMQQRVQSMSPAERQRLQQMLGDLNRLLENREAGAESQFQDFLEQYGDLFPQGAPESLEALLEQLAQQMQAMQNLMHSMSASQRQELQEALQQVFGDAAMQQAVAELLQHVQAHLQQQGLGDGFRFTGEAALPLQEALRLMERLQSLERLEDTLERVVWGADAQQLDAEQVRQLMGEETHGQVRALQELAEQLTRQGYMRQNQNRLELTARGIRRIAHKAMLDIFASLRRDQFGKHGAQRRGPGGQRLEETQAYVYGDPFDVHLARTVMNAVLRSAARPPLSLAADDFEVYGAEAVSRCSTVLLLDMSGSMERFSRFAAAKKVALALDALIRTQFPRDTLHIVGFFTYAEELKLGDLPYLAPKPFGFFPYMYSDMYHNPMGYLDIQIEAAEAIAGRVDIPQAFTNIQAGLQVASHLLGRQHTVNKQVILITDGEPTAHIRDRKLCLEYPPSQRTLLETLKEVKRCTRHGITINTFMLGQDYYMERFVNQLTRINRGRAFFTAPENIGDYILVDYLTNRRKKVA